MKYLTIFSVVLMVVAYLDFCSARSEPVCGYTDSEGKMIFLKYLPYLQKGEDHVDFGSDGKCIKRATCLEDYTLKTEECADVKITCENKSQFNDGVFPKCCIKC